MIRMFQSQTVAQAKNYFASALSRADYYLEDQEMGGQYHGEIAKRLGLDGKHVDKASFEKLCDNINPQTGKNLTPRTVADRRVGYDISFHCPKSVSIVHALSGDRQILNAFENSVQATMNEMQADAQTRIRSQGQYDDRSTGELLWTGFTHQTARPVEGHPPDPHLHRHCFTFNVTYDTVENRFKAGQFFAIKRDMPYYQARFQKRLADALSDQGYDIRKTKNGFELAVVPQAAIEHFSKRTNLIGQVAKEKGITSAKDLDQLGSRTRAAKQKNLTMPELREKWQQQLKDKGIDERAKSEVKTTNHALRAKDAIDHAISHEFSRYSVRRDRQILAQSYLHAIDNKDVSIKELDQALAKDERLFKIQVGSQQLCTTALVHQQEREMIQRARDGIGKLRPINPNYSGDNHPHLSQEQQAVMRHVMSSGDRLSMIRGGAGTGKTTLLKTIIPDIEKTGKEVHLYAPTAQASRGVLKAEGFDHAETVSKLLNDKSKHASLEGQVIWVDEAGMLGVKDTNAILKLADQYNARVIFSGDPRQHSAVDRGDAMRLLKQVGYIRQVSLETIYRQKTDTYKQAVKAISQGNVSDGFKRLDTMKAIEEIDQTKVDEKICADFLKARENKKSALVVSPTRAKAVSLNTAIRQGLQDNKHIGKREKSYTTYQSLYWTQAQKQDARLYDKDMVIQTHQNMPGIKRGSVLNVHEVTNGLVKVKDQANNTHHLPLDRAKDFDVYWQNQIKLAKGDEIVINKNGYDRNKKRLNNGSVLTVTGFTKDGAIRAEKRTKSKSNSVTLDPKHGNFDYAYVTTSHKAQGKTVDQVIIAQPSTTFAASNQKQFYVSVSRGREGVKIYTDDKQDLLKQIQSSGNRQGATELIREDYFTTPTVDIETSKERRKDITQDKTDETEKTNYHDTRNIEPEI